MIAYTVKKTEDYKEVKMGNQVENFDKDLKHKIKKPKVKTVVPKVKGMI